jgi:hypothetical protein
MQYELSTNFHGDWVLEHDTKLEHQIVVGYANTVPEFLVILLQFWRQQGQDLATFRSLASKEEPSSCLDNLEYLLEGAIPEAVDASVYHRHSIIRSSSSPLAYQLICKDRNLVFLMEGKVAMELPVSSVPSVINQIFELSAQHKVHPQEELSEVVMEYLRRK